VHISDDRDPFAAKDCDGQMLQDTVLGHRVDIPEEVSQLAKEDPLAAFNRLMQEKDKKKGIMDAEKHYGPAPPARPNTTSIDPRYLPNEHPTYGPKCFNCNAYGHLARECLQPRQQQPRFTPLARRLYESELHYRPSHYRRRMSSDPPESEDSEDERRRRRRERSPASSSSKRKSKKRKKERKRSRSRSRSKSRSRSRSKSRSRRKSSKEGRRRRRRRSRSRPRDNPEADHDQAEKPASEAVQEEVKAKADLAVAAREKSEGREYLPNPEGCDEEAREGDLLREEVQSGQNEPSQKMDAEEALSSKQALDQSAPAKDNPVPALDQSAPAKDSPEPALDQSAPAKDNPMPALDQSAPAKDSPEPALDQSAPAKDNPVPALDQSAPAKYNPERALDQSAPAKNSPEPALDKSTPAKNSPELALDQSTPAKDGPERALDQSAPAKDSPEPAVEPAPAEEHTLKEPATDDGQEEELPALALSKDKEREIRLNSDAGPLGRSGRETSPDYSTSAYATSVENGLLAEDASSLAEPDPPDAFKPIAVKSVGGDDVASSEDFGGRRLLQNPEGPPQPVAGSTTDAVPVAGHVPEASASKDNEASSLVEKLARGQTFERKRRGTSDKEPRAGPSNRRAASKQPASSSEKRGKRKKSRSVRLFIHGTLLLLLLLVVVIVVVLSVLSASSSPNSFCPL